MLSNVLSGRCGCFFASLLGSARIEGGRKLIWSFIRYVAVRYTTVLPDVELLRLPPPRPEHRIQGNAVVAGGSLAGFLAARILVDYFTEVTIIETDMGLELPGSRVGQRGHLHGYTSIAYRALRSLFPNFDEEAKKDGANLYTIENRWIIGGIRMYSVGDKIILSRTGLEALLRRLVTTYAGPSLKVIEGTVTGLKASSDGSRIESVLLRLGTGVAGSPSSQQIQCALFADCSGASCISNKYLVSSSVGASWGPFTKHTYAPNLSYVSAIWEVPERVRDRIARMLPKDAVDFGQWDRIPSLQAFTSTFATGKTNYAIQKLEGNRLLFLQSGWAVDRFVTNISDFIEMVEDVQNQTFSGSSELKKEHEWIIPVLNMILDEEPDIDSTLKFYPYKLNQAQWIEYEAGKLPSNFVALGDSRMRVNPFFRQGVGKSLIDAAVLNTTLHSLFSPASSSPPNIPSSFSYNYFKRNIRFIKGLYDMNRALDYGQDTTGLAAGETREYGRWFRKYWIGVLKVAANDKELTNHLSKYLGGAEPTVELFYPSLVLRVLLNEGFGILL